MVCKSRILERVADTSARMNNFDYGYLKCLDFNIQYWVLYLLLALQMFGSEWRSNELDKDWFIRRGETRFQHECFEYDLCILIVSSHHNRNIGAVTSVKLSRHSAFPSLQSGVWNAYLLAGVEHKPQRSKAKCRHHVQFAFPWTMTVFLSTYMGYVRYYTSMRHCDK